MKIIFSSNISWSIYNFRTPLLKSLQRDGHIIYTVSSKDKYSDKLKNEGFVFNEVKLNNNSKNPVKDIKLIYQYYKIYKKIKPDVICHNAIKPNIYGTIAAAFLHIPVINNISGLGTLFIKESFSTKIAKKLYKYSQKKASKVFFQNNDDLDLFIKNKLVDSNKCLLIPGSGVDTNKFKPVIRSANKFFNFLFVGRLISDKGIIEFIEGARIIKKKYKDVVFNILGPLYITNETSISAKDLDEWEKEGIIKYLGQTDEVAKEMAKSDCVVLPSYREGMSKVLIEASSMGIPIVTANVPGCKDIVIDNDTGFLAEVKNSKDLAAKMEKMILLSNEERNNMGLKARKLVLDVFDEKIIIKHYKDAIQSVL